MREVIKIYPSAYETSIGSTITVSEPPVYAEVRVEREVTPVYASTSQQRPMVSISSIAHDKIYYGKGREVH